MAPFFFCLCSSFCGILDLVKFRTDCSTTPQPPENRRLRSVSVRARRELTRTKRKSTTEALCPYGAYAFLEIIAQLNDANRVRRCVNVQISASGTIPVESHNFGMRDVSKDIERLIVSRPYLIRVIAIISDFQLFTGCPVTQYGFLLHRASLPQAAALDRGSLSTDFKIRSS